MRALQWISSSRSAQLLGMPMVSVMLCSTWMFVTARVVDEQHRPIASAHLNTQQTEKPSESITPRYRPIPTDGLVRGDHARAVDRTSFSDDDPYIDGDALLAAQHAPRADFVRHEPGVAWATNSCLGRVSR